MGVIGLGLLGSALADRLIDGGYGVRVWNRTADKAAPLLARGAEWSSNPLADCERVVVCLYTTSVVEEVLDHMGRGLDCRRTVVDCTTGEPRQAVALGERLAERGVQYLESPIAASSDQTRKGEALAFVGGDRVVFERCADLYRWLAAKAVYVGPWGSAGRIKLVNNLVLGLNRAALAEGLLFAESVGLDPETTLDVLMAGNCYSRVMDTKGQKMIRRDFATQAKLSQHAKDIGIVLAEARRAKRRLPFTELHRTMLQRGELLGLGDRDNSAIIEAIASESPTPVIYTPPTET